MSDLVQITLSLCDSVFLALNGWNSGGVVRLYRHNRSNVLEQCLNTEKHQNDKLFSFSFMTFSSLSFSMPSPSLLYSLAVPFAYFLSSSVGDFLFSSFTHRLNVLSLEEDSQSFNMKRNSLFSISAICLLSLWQSKGLQKMFALVLFYITLHICFWCSM